MGPAPLASNSALTAFVFLGEDDSAEFLALLLTILEFHLRKNRGTTWELLTQGGSSYKSSNPKERLKPDQANPVNQDKNKMEGKLASKSGDSLGVEESPFPLGC